jgi:H+/Na+-translocating ferredoxin:NAD+ oxidoreductase subunit D
MSDASLVSGPHAHGAISVSRTMSLVMLALLPATLFGIYIYGWPALNLFLVTVVSAVAAEAACLKLAGKAVRPYVMDGSAALTGWLLAMTLPPWAPWWIGVTGSLIAIVVAKQVFGGIGQNLFNPAMVARVALLITFPLEMTTFVLPKPLFGSDAPGFLQGLGISFGPGFAVDAVSSASTLGHVKTELGRHVPLDSALAPVFDSLKSFLGYMPGSLGETSALLILAGGLYLLIRRIITWHIPFAMIASLLGLAALFHWINPDLCAGPLVHLLSGATLLGAFFIATDLVTSPVTPAGQLLFGAGCGLLVFVIRTWAGYPEGMAFAVMLMNALTPLIDHYIRPRVYGRSRKGEPLVYERGPGSSP